DTAQDRIDGDFALRRAISIPITQVSGDDVIYGDWRLHDLTVALRLPLPDLQALLVFTIVTAILFLALFRLDVLLESQTSNRNRQIGFFSNVIGIGLGLQARIERRVVAQKAEGESIRHPVFFQAGALALGHRVYFQAPNKHTDAWQVVAA